LRIKINKLKIDLEKKLRAMILISESAIERKISNFVTLMKGDKALIHRIFKNFDR
jgi:hypothetical protein